jgi:hypothetical protein
MKRARHSRLSILAAVLIAAMAAPYVFARVDSEVSTTDKRKVSVEKASAIAKQIKPTVLPTTINQPFAPPGFDLTDAEEAAAAAAAARLANPNGPVTAPVSDHQLLEDITAKVHPGGTVTMGGRPLLMFGNSFVKIGSHFTVTYKGMDYDLELTQIDSTNFTLRYKNDEITRPIHAEQPAKSP